MHRSNCASYSTTSSALASNDCGIITPIALAVLRLTTTRTWSTPVLEDWPFLALEDAIELAANRYWSMKFGPYDIKPPATGTQDVRLDTQYCCGKRS
jgi:hypothetical protein